jgi:hypothetical protein
MNYKSSYTPEEWAKLMDLPMIAGTAVIMASPNPMGLPDEVSAEGAAYALRQPGAEGELLSALRADLHERWARRDDLDAPSTDLPLYTGSLHYSEPGRASEELSALAVEVVAILEDKAAPEEIAAYKQFVMDTAGAIARASKEGGFLGFGRKETSAQEQAVLDALSAALGMGELA